MIIRNYYAIDEELAYRARQQWSFREYVKGSTTEDYQNDVNAVYELVELVSVQKPDYLTQALLLAERYSRNLADWWNTKHRIDMMCPSVMISGPANFPVRKKERQIAREKAHFEKLSYIKGIKGKIENILKGNTIIKSNDDNAIEKLQEKLDELITLKEGMIEANKYYKSHGTLEGFTGLKQETIERTMNLISMGVIFGTTVYDTTNTNAKIKATKTRIEQLQKAKVAGIAVTMHTDVCKVIENSELMRIQLVFDTIPSETIRSVLKSNGFKWSPHNKAWQRQLTENAKFTTKRVIDQINQLHTA